MIEALPALLAGVLGLLLGSFANVVIYRVPAGESIVSPPSACPACGHQIRARHNVPVLGWLVLRGRCFDCKEPISARYPLVEAITGLSFAMVTAIVGLTSSLPLLLVLVFFTVVLGAIDFDTYRLPDRVTLPFAIATIVCVLIAAEGWGDIARAGLGALALGAFYAIAFFLFPRGMGWGDVKLAVILGAVMAVFGWSELIVGGFSAFAWGSVVGVGAMVLRRQRRGLRIPFGPWMFAGAWTGILAGPSVVGWYLNVTGLT